jgi:tetratricopeptide (TPR) repeat protein
MRPLCLLIPFLPALALGEGAAAPAPLPLKGPSPTLVVTLDATDPGVQDSLPKVLSSLQTGIQADNRAKWVALGGDEPVATEDLTPQLKPHLDAAKAAYDGLDLDGAVKEYAEAIKVYFAHPLTADPKAAAGVFLQLGSAYQLNQDKSHADGAYRYALALAPDLVPDPENYGPDIRDAFTALKASLDKDQDASPTMLDVESVKGARVFVDGRDAGTAPVRGLKVYPGRHLVTVRSSGYKPQGVVATARPADRERLKVDLEETPEHQQFAGAISHAQAERQLATVGPGVQELASAAKADLVVVGSLSSDGLNTKIELVLFDAQHKRRLAGVTRATLVESSRFAGEMNALAIELINDYVEPPANVAEEEPETPGESKPLLKRWYVWAGAGVVVVGAAAVGTTYLVEPSGLSHAVGLSVGIP